MKNMESMLTILVSTFVMVGVVLSGLGKVDAWLELKRETWRSETIIACANASRYTYNEKSANWERITEEPSQKFYEECLALNNIQTQ